MIPAVDQWIIFRVAGDQPKSFGSPMTARQIKAPQMSTLSASGSKILPNLLVTFNALAIGPSIISVRAVITKRTKAVSKKDCLFLAAG